MALTRIICWELSIRFRNSGCGDIFFGRFAFWVSFCAGVVFFAVAVADLLFAAAVLLPFFGVLLAICLLMWKGRSDSLKRADFFLLGLF